MPLSAQVNCVPSNGDTNDNAVDINDGFFWYQAYRAYNENIDNYDLNADFDCSGEVDIIDGYIWYKAWKDPAVPTNTPIITNTTIPTNTNQPSLLTLNLIPPNENLPIEIPRPNRLFDFACTTSQSTFPTTAETWIAQKSNDGINYCSPDTLTTSTSCSGANIQRHTPGMGICIWNSSTRKLRLDTNSATMPLNGCSINSNPWNVANPGGYSSQLVSDYTRKSQYLNSPSYELGKMSTLFLEFEFGIIEYTQSSCPPGVIDPITQTTTPVAQSMIGIMFNEVDLVTNATLSTVFYQLMLYDSRPEYRQYDSGRYIHCILPNSTSGGNPFVLISNSLAYYGQSYPTIGGSLKYSLNLLPQIVEGIRSCRGNNVDLNRYKLAGTFLSNEVMNSAGLDTIFTQPLLNIHINQ